MCDFKTTLDVKTEVILDLMAFHPVMNLKMIVLGNERQRGLS